MRYQNLRSFQKHLENGSASYLCRCYLAQVSDDYERGQALSAVRKNLPPMDWLMWSGPEKGVREISDALLSPSLFGDGPAILLDEVEKMGKKDLQVLAGLVADPNLSGYIICGSRSKTILGAVFEKAGVVLDLSEEKPWDRDKRLALQLADRAKQAGKQLNPDAASFLGEKLGSDASLLDRELDKLICFVGDRPVIRREDAVLICAGSRTQTLWALAEQMVWEKERLRLEGNSFHGLIPALRSQFSLGLKIGSLLASGCPKDQWGSYLPKIWPKTLEKRIEQANRLGVSYFEKGMELLFQIELLSRTGQAREDAMLDLLWCSLGR